MKTLIPMDDLGVFVNNHDTARVDSLFVAKLFEKNHKEVLRDIRKITDPASGLSEEFRQRNFAPSSYRNQQNRKQPCYCLTRDGFTMLVMGYTGQKAMQFKELYIKRFNDIDLLGVLQKVDIGLLVSVPDFQARKCHLEWYAARLRKEDDDGK